MKTTITGVVYDSRGRIIALPIDYYTQYILLYGNYTTPEQLWKDK